MVNQNNNEIIWSGLKFKAVEKIGESIDIHHLKFNLNDKSTSTEIRKHCYYDGVGALADILKKQGYEIKRLPLQIIGKDPGLWQRIKLMFQFFSHAGKMNDLWKEDVDFNKIGANQECAFAYFTKEQSEFIAKVKKTKFSSFLIQQIDRACLPYLTKNNKNRKWILPINMRSKKDKLDYRNFTSSFVLHTGSEIGVNQLQEEINNSIRTNLHWGSWQYTLIPKYLHKKILYYLASKTKNQAFGFLSNLGSWPGKNITHHDQNEIDKYLWIPISLATAVVPVATGVLNWNGRTVLSLRLHSSLNVNADVTKNIMRDWINNIYNNSEMKGEIPEVYIKELD